VIKFYSLNARHSLTLHPTLTVLGLCTPFGAGDMRRPSSLAPRITRLLSQLVASLWQNIWKAATMGNRWQHCAWTVPLQPPINAEHEAGQAASIVFEVWVW